MRVGRLIVFLGVAAALAGMAATAGARTNSARTTTVTFWDAYSAGGGEVKTLESVVIPGFEKTHPGIVVKDVTIPYDDLHQKLVTGVAGGQLPDLVRSDIIWVPELANLGVLAPLDEVMPDFKKYAARVFKGPLATNYWKGHYYGLPLDTNTRIFNYNPAALNAIGVNGPPKTFAQLISDSALAKAKGYDLYAESGTSCWNICPWIWSNGGSVTNSTYTKATGYLNGPKSVAAIQMLVNLYKAGEMPGIIINPNAGLGTYDGINQNKYVGTLDGPWMDAIFSAAYPKTNVVGSLLPAGPAGSISVVGGEDIVMTKASKNKTAALEFLRYMLGYGTQAQLALAGQMPVLTSSSKWLTRVHPYYATYVKQLATAKPRTPTPKWTQIDQVITTDVANAFQGSESVQQALTDAAKQIDGLLK
ncbi:MAG TPA: extracellular solute-binding protein [Gaiellaceae bacterium]|nr:extracellular solute-binding protein [Gaiellaceae bacterium]